MAPKIARCPTHPHPILSALTHSLTHLSSDCLLDKHFIQHRALSTLALRTPVCCNLNLPSARCAVLPPRPICLIPISTVMRTHGSSAWSHSCYDLGSPRYLSAKSTCPRSSSQLHIKGTIYNPFPILLIITRSKSPQHPSLHLLSAFSPPSLLIPAGIFQNGQGSLFRSSLARHSYLCRHRP